MRLLLLLFLFFSCSQKKDTSVRLKFQSFVENDESSISCFRVLVQRIGSAQNGKCWIPGKTTPDLQYQESSLNIKPGREFSLMLASSTNYSFHLIGFENALSCPDLELSGLNASSVKVFYLDSSVKYIEAGKENTVELSSNESDKQGVSKCTGGGFAFCEECFLLGVDKLNEGKRLSF